MKQTPQWTRQCKDCQDVIYYKRYNSYWMAKQRDSSCGTCGSKNGGKTRNENEKEKKSKELTGETMTYTQNLLNRRFLIRLLDKFKVYGSTPLAITISIYKYFNRINNKIADDVSKWLNDWVAYSIEDHQNVIEELKTIKGPKLDFLSKINDLQMGGETYAMTQKDLDLETDCPKCGATTKFNKIQYYLLTGKQDRLCDPCRKEKSAENKKQNMSIKYSHTHKRFDCPQCYQARYFPIGEEYNDAIFRDKLCETCEQHNKKTEISGKYKKSSIVCESCSKVEVFTSFKKAYRHGNEHGLVCKGCATTNAQFKRTSMWPTNTTQTNKSKI